MKIKLLKKKKEGKDIKSFIFEKPKGFNFKPGQFIYLTLPKLFLTIKEEIQGTLPLPHLQQKNI